MEWKEIATILVLAFGSSISGQTVQLSQPEVTFSETAEAGQIARPGFPGKPSQKMVLAQGFKRSPRGVVAYAAAGSGERTRTTIIRTSEVDPKINDQLQEDLAVMYRILEKAIGERTQDENVIRMGIPLLNLQGGGSRCLYLEDYGVVFTFLVDMPLLPESKTEKAADESEDPTNEEWEETRNEVLGKKENRRSAKAARPFDAGEVEELQKAILEALKNATNIRNLNPADFITVVLRGKRFESTIWSGDSEPFRIEVEQDTFFSREERPGESTMVIRIRKSDLDTLAKNKGDKTALKEKISITTY